jgi:hypothetical protein
MIHLELVTMRANHIPRRVRLESRISKLELRYEMGHVLSPSSGNPYWCCKECGIHDPELSIRNGQHFRGCQRGGLQKEIAYYKKLLDEEVS